ncbi:phosphoadenosine phosphosulfate reductase family protein [Moellerella wisconsensis]|uniref:phosphoadenosine phosphosulfate reductase domain-containing protein n=1 Tax=Moellerella wisconsensis TaxID=158849 RepID=UPI00241080C1|nr:phosphoadenosine phosphosulfate reductase family protein [Moellerella wisconsensis]
MQHSFNFDNQVPPSISVLKADKWQAVWHTLKEDADLNYRDASRGVSLSDLINDGTASIYQALTDNWTISLAWSSGKDSEVVLHLFLMALVRAVRAGIPISQHHYLLHTDTGIENPEIRWLADQKLAALEKFIEQEDLPLSIVLAKPGLTSSWTGRILTGRGLPTFTNSSVRQCSNDLKIFAAKRAKTAYVKNLPKSVRERVCLLLGSRDAEGAIRAKNIALKGGSASRVKVTKEGGELYPIRHWLQGDVWEFLLSAGSAPKYLLPSYLENNNDTAELYKAATGECVWSGSEKKSSEACGSRFGCWACQAVGLDKSMENLLRSDDDRHGYMAGLNRIQRFLSKRRNAWEDRHPVGRTLYAGGFIKVQPDVYSPRFLERLLHICCSMDYVEQLRADEMAEKLRSGELENTAHNRRMASPQFRIVSETALIHIDFMWSFHQFNDKPFHALEIYRRVWVKGELDLLDDEPGMPVAPKAPMPKALWVKVGQFGDDSGIDGLADPIAEMAYFDVGDDERASRVINTPNGKRRVVSFSEDSEVTIDSDAAEFIIWEEYLRLRNAVLAGQYTSGSAAQFYLRFGAISLCKGKSALYNRMMQRGQTYRVLGLNGHQTMDGIASRKDLRVLTTDHYQSLIANRVKASVIRLRWWANLAFTIQYHLANRTSTGQWIRAVLACEDEQSVLQEKNRAKNNVSVFVIGHTSAWCSLKLSAPGTSTERGFRRYHQHTRRNAFKSCQGLSPNFRDMIINQLKLEYLRMLWRLDDGLTLEHDSNPITKMAEQDAVALGRHLRLMVRTMDRFVQGTA